VSAYDERVADSTPEQRAAGVRQALEVASAAGLQAAGSFATDVDHAATANTSGLFHEQRSTSAGFTLTAITPDSSGWAESSGIRLSEVDPAATAEKAVRKALAARSPADLPPGEYPVVLEAEA